MNRRQRLILVTLSRGGTLNIDQRGHHFLEGLRVSGKDVCKLENADMIAFRSNGTYALCRAGLRALEDA